MSFESVGSPWYREKQKSESIGNQEGMATALRIYSFV